ncbi:MAG: PQQ-binding-like beta-propeller repeat protein [Acidobacteriota bacterium]
MDPPRVTAPSIGVAVAGTATTQHLRRRMAVLALGLLAQPSLADDWPQIRGPQRDGIASISEVEPAWNPALAWRRPIGEGFSGIAVVGSALYTLAAEDGREVVLSLHVGDGVERWRQELGPTFQNEFGNGPRSTPAVADGTVYVLSSHGLLAALDAVDGHARWQVDLPTTVGSHVPRFGYSPSPLIDSDAVLLEVGGGDGRSIAAFDRTTGAVRWTAHSDRLGYASPIILGAASDPKRQLIFVTPTWVVGLSPVGETLWRWPIPDGSAIDQPIAMPVAIAEDRLFVAHRATGGSALLRLPSPGERVEPETIWESSRFRNHLSSAVVVGGHLYGFHNAIFRCLDATTGQECWAHRGFGKGSLIARGYQLLVLADDGQLAGVRADPRSFQEIGRLQALEGRSWTAPAAAGEALYLRNHQEIARVDFSAGPASRKQTAASDLPTPRVTTPKPTSLTDLTSLLEAHARARGGRERLQQVRSLRLQGRYAENSVYSNFTLIRQAPNRYRLELRRDGQTRIDVFDGERGWRVDPSAEPALAWLSAGELANLRAEVEIHGPLVDAMAPSLRLELVGPATTDRGAAWALRLTRPIGAVETHFVDQVSHLAVERHSEVHAHDEIWPLQTYYSDHRPVAGLVVPHLIELEFSSLHRLWRIESLEVDPPIEPDLFTPPASLTDEAGAAAPPPPT